jgi:hypothetical protein
MNMDGCERAGPGRFHRKDKYRYRHKYGPVRAGVGPVRRKTLALGVAMPRERHYSRRIHARERGPVRFDDGRRANGATIIHKYLQWELRQYLNIIEASYCQRWHGRAWERMKNIPCIRRSII